MNFDPTDLLYIPVFLFSLTLHEYAHALLAKKGGDLTAAYQGRLTLNPLAHIDPIGTLLLPGIALISHAPLIGWAKPVPVDEQRFRRSDWMVWVSLAGPASNLLIVIVVTLLAKLTLRAFGSDALDPFIGALRERQIDGAAGLVSLLVIMFIQLNIVLFIFNLLPIPPLDGSKIAWYLVFRRNEGLYPLWVTLNQYGFFILMIMMFIPSLRNALSMLYLIPMTQIFTWLLA